MKRFVIPVLGTLIFLIAAGIACLAKINKLPKFLKFKKNVKENS